MLLLFGTLIQPILTYASEIWIYDYKIDLMNDKYPFELVQLKTCKFSLGVHSKTSNLATRCDSSRYHILISIFKLGIRDLESIDHSDFLSQIFHVIQSDVAVTKSSALECTFQPDESCLLLLPLCVGFIFRSVFFM